MTSHSQAAVTVTFEQVGSDVVASWSGSIDAGVWDRDRVAGEVLAGPTFLIFVVGAAEIYVGAASNTSLIGNITGFSGIAGFINSDLYVGGVDNGVSPASSVYDFDSLNVSQTFGNQSLADIGASSFDNTLAWTSSAGGTNTISYTTVPEVSSALLGCAGLFGLALRRRR